MNSSIRSQEDLLQEGPELPGRPMHGQEASVAVCSALAALSTPFALFLKKQCRHSHWDTSVLGGLWSVPSGTQ